MKKTSPSQHKPNESNGREMDKNLCDYQETWEKIVDKGFQDYSSLTGPERVWFNVESLISMVSNGGLCSYFCEDTVTHVFDTITDLKLLGANDIVVLLEKMNSLFPNGQPSEDIDDRMEIMGTWEEHDQLLEALDDEFFEKDEALENALVDYILENKLAAPAENSVMSI
ncbi:MAG: DUF4375 domain-containing protein [Chlamydiales bacterium]|nr:DUF4375 domain-containing protein [Chlamydiales bacterium]